MKVAPSISVIVPVYNRAGVIVRALGSIAAQNASEGVELIVVDNGSTDGSMEVARDWAEKNSVPGMSVRFATESRRGAAAARAAGVRLAEAPVVCFFDSDDEMAPGALKAYIDAFASDSHTQIVAGTADIISLDGSRFSFRHRSGDPLIAHLNHSILSTVRYAVRRDYLLSCGGWNPQIPIWNDWELGMRLLLPSPRLMRISLCVAHMHASEDSITGHCFSSRSFDVYAHAVNSAMKAVDSSSRADRSRLRGLLLYRLMTLSALFAREARTLPDEAFHSGRLAYPDRQSLLEASRRIAADTLHDTRALPGLRRRTLLRFTLRLTHLWTRLGLRGAASIATRLI